MRLFNSCYVLVYELVSFSHRHVLKTGNVAMEMYRLGTVVDWQHEYMSRVCICNLGSK